MGLFSLFGKREPSSEQSNAKRIAPAGKTVLAGNRPQTPARSQATALKIDAIESEMSSEFMDLARKRTINPPSSVARAPGASPLTLAAPAMGAATTFLLDAETIARTIAVSASEAAPAIDEAAIMFALGQLNVVEELLQSAIRDDATGKGAPLAWAMLFDLYQVTHEHALFDALAIAYAEQFQTSPPDWHELTEDAVQQSAAKPAPSIVFSGQVDAGITRQLERMRSLPADTPSVRLDFSQVYGADPVGCGLLLSGLKTLQKSGTDLILSGAPQLATKIRDILKVGRRDETAAPWLLLLEIYRLLHLEQEFDDCSMDYCVTFEVSPPSYSPPSNKVTVAQPERDLTAAVIEIFPMPAVIAENFDEHLQAIIGFAASHNPAVFDCSRLIRIDFNAASMLMAQLQPLVAKGSRIEFNEVNHLVQALLKVIGLQDLLHIRLRRN